MNNNSSKQVQPNSNPQATTFQQLWMSVTSLILGILAFLGSLSDSFEEDELLGLFMFIAASAILGIASIRQKKEGRGMAIAGIILSAMAFFMMW